MAVNFREEAELYYPLHVWQANCSTSLAYRRFKTVAAAIQFAVEATIPGLCSQALFWRSAI
jgi:hypothetical protein